MKKSLISILLILSMLVTGVTVFAEEDEDYNIIPEKDSGFESVTSVEETEWFLLFNSNGDKNGRKYDNMSIKTDGGHTGKNYISMTGKYSWYSPAINLYPYFKEAGQGEYIISLYVRGTKIPSAFMIRCLEKDVNVELEEDFPWLKSKSAGNYYSSTKINSESSTNWTRLTTDAFEVTEAAISDPSHNWWFCFGSFPEGEFIFEIDDLQIIPASEYVDPSELPSTDVSYIDAKTKNNALPVSTPNADNADNGDDSNGNAPTPTPITVQGENKDITVIVAVGAFIVAAAVGLAVVVIIRKKSKKEQ